MAIFGGNITLDSTEGVDKITQTDKVTSPYFSDGNVNLAAANITRSQNLTSTTQTYFEGISISTSPTVEEFNVALFHSDLRSSGFSGLSVIMSHSF